MTESHTVEDATVMFRGDRETGEFAHAEVLPGGFVRLSRAESERVELIPREEIQKVVSQST